MLNLTANEKRALLVTCLIIIFAALIQYISPYFIHHQNIDYSQSDSVFYRLSSMRQSATKYKSFKEPTKHTKQEKQLQLKSIDLNRAGKKELEQLPRVGPKTAERILKYRKSVKRFSSNKELMQVKGIGPKTFDRIKPYLKDI
jgi:comEA protein